MKRINTIIALTLIISTFLLFADNHKAKDFELKDTHGKAHKLSDYSGKWVVLEWINFGCPFVKKHYDSDNMQKLQKKYTAKDVVWLSICSSADGKQGHFSDMKELNKKIKEYKCKNTAYLIDESGKVGKAYGARTTPQIVVISPDGHIVYNGAIDDKASTSQDDIKDSKNYVVEVLDAVLSGKEAPYSKTKPYGCSVKY